ncbi:hypothetical protein ACOSQ3_009505 [Xanthoceras sorbifolium]
MSFANLPHSSTFVSSMLAAKWCAPDFNCIKINTDASLDTQHGVIGFGIVIRDHLGAILASNAQRIIAGFSVQIVKTLGILRGLKFARDSSLLPAVLKSDAMSVVCY